MQFALAGWIFQDKRKTQNAGLELVYLFWTALKNCKTFPCLRFNVLFKPYSQMQQSWLYICWSFTKSPVIVNLPLHKRLVPYSLLCGILFTKTYSQFQGPIKKLCHKPYCLIAFYKYVTNLLSQILNKTTIST